MYVIDLRATAVAPIAEFGSIGASAAHLASGGGDAHVYVVEIGAGGVIGPHEAGFDQLFVPVSGGGWAAGADGVRHSISVGQAALITRGERHEKGSDTGLTALMVQVEHLSALGVQRPTSRA
jgi:quercetin dioxygenase-like cupin family protein